MRDILIQTSHTIASTCFYVKATVMTHFLFAFVKHDKRSKKNATQKNGWR